MNVADNYACPFCERIRNAQYGSTSLVDIVHFSPLDPVVPGHMLFVPREHVTSAISSETGARLAGKALTAASIWALDQMLLSRGKDGPEGYNFITSCGMAATQTVWHIHVHAVPRREDDGLKLPWTGQVK